MASLTGQKRSLKSVMCSAPKKRKIFAEQNIVFGIDTKDSSRKIGRDMDEVTRQLSAEDVIPTRCVLLYDLAAVLEHCDVIALCAPTALPLSVNYFRGSHGKAWLKFEDRATALRVVAALNGSEVEGRTLRAGLIEYTPRFVDIKNAHCTFQTAENEAFPKKNKNQEKKKDAIAELKRKKNQKKNQKKGRTRKNRGRKKRNA